MGVLLPNYPEENVVKGDNMPNFSKMNGGRTGNGTAHGTSHSTKNGISYVNTGNGTGSGTPDCADHTSNIFQILNDIQKRQRAVQCQYNSSTVPTAPETETPFRTTTPSTPTMTAKQALGMQNLQNISRSGPPAHCARQQATETGFQTRRLVNLEKSPAPAQWKDFCEQTPIDKARHSVTLFQLL